MSVSIVCLGIELDSREANKLTATCKYVGLSSAPLRRRYWVSRNAMQPPVYARTQNKPAQKSAVFLTSFIKVDFPSTDQPCNLDSSERRVCERHEGPPSKPLQVIVLHAGIAAILFLAF